MRHEILGTPVNGSARLIIVPQCDYGSGHVAVPRSIAESMVIPAASLDPHSGEYSYSITERRLKAGDWVILVRPPSLTHNSVQPMRVVIWEEPTLGISHDDVSMFHGDFDGDEMHIYPVYRPESIRECESWMHETNRDFAKAREVMATRAADRAGTGLYDFMKFTTMSMRQIMLGHRMPMCAKASRMKADYVRQTGLRFSDPSARGIYATCPG